MTPRSRLAAPRLPGGDTLSINDLERHAVDWINVCEGALLSNRTLEARRNQTQKLLWFLRLRGYTSCGPSELRAFFAYVQNGHEDAADRWSHERLNKGVRPRTIHEYYGDLRTFFRFLVDDGALEVSPMDRIKAPIARADQVQPFTAGLQRPSPRLRRARGFGVRARHQ